MELTLIHFEFPDEVSDEERMLVHRKILASMAAERAEAEEAEIRAREPYKVAYEEAHKALRKAERAYLKAGGKPYLDAMWHATTYNHGY